MEFVCPKCGSHYFSVVDGAVRCNGDSSEGPRTCDFSIPTLAKICGTAITSRNKDAETVPLSGIPADRLDHYLQVLVRAGKRVAVCEQFMPKHSIGVNWAARKV